MPRPTPLTAEWAYSTNYDYEPLTPRTPHSRAGRAEEQPVGDEDDYELEVIHGLGDTNANGAHMQSEPLLASSASATFPHRVRTFEDSERMRKHRKVELSVSLVLSRLPIVAGGASAIFLLFLVFLSLKRPDVLQSAVGLDANSTSPESVAEASDAAAPSPSQSQVHETHVAPILSYENYTSFPLTPLQYREECGKWFSRGSHMHPYWWVPAEGPMDVVHHDDELAQTTHLPEAESKRVCNSTITYMLDGYVGLAADLALMAQVAAHAREVRVAICRMDSTFLHTSKRGTFTSPKTATCVPALFSGSCILQYF